MWPIFKTIFGGYLVSTNGIDFTPSSCRQVVYDHFSNLVNGDDEYLPASDVVCVQTQWFEGLKHCSA